MPVDICPAVVDNVAQRVASSAQHRKMQNGRPGNVDGIHNSVDHDQFDIGSSLTQGLPSKVSNHLTGAACSSEILEDKFRCMPGLLPVAECWF